MLLLFNWIVRVSPRRYWLWAWLVSLPLIVLSVLAAPLLEPIFNKFEPLAKTHPALVAKLETVVARTGTQIAPDRMFLMKASDKTQRPERLRHRHRRHQALRRLGHDRRPHSRRRSALHLRPRERPLRSQPHSQRDLRHRCRHVLRLLGLRRIRRLAGAPLWRTLAAWAGTDVGQTALASRQGFLVLLFALSVAGFCCNRPATPSAATSSMRPMSTAKRPSTASSPTRKRPPSPPSTIWAKPGWKTPIPTPSSSSGSTAIPASRPARTSRCTMTPGRMAGREGSLRSRE